VSILSVNTLGKAYRKYDSELNRVASWFGFTPNIADEHWVLRNVTFSIAPGSAVGIVGQNGAGKSTLLKLITGTLRPTHGDVHINGRISAILELGMGFNPEFTGRQNALHSLGLMGFSSRDTKSFLCDIESFADIGEYFDQPVRTYSSGMQVRLAFSVATAFVPDLLIVDEALSVGDAYFQHKSFNRIREFQKLGCTLLLVSHDRSAIQTLCARAILLDRGSIIKDGKPEEVMNFYNAIIAEKEEATITTLEHVEGKQQTISGSGKARVTDIGLQNERGLTVTQVNVGESVSLIINVEVYQDISVLVLGYMIKDRLGQPVYGTNTWHTKQKQMNLKTGDIISYAIRFPVNLGPGSYSISTALTSTDTHLVDNYEWRDLALVFNVSNIDKPLFVGTAWIPPVIEVRER
jgi:lipopolysaccharide transport system ATP-binding protein